jgi:hypothetical protein
MQTPHSRARTLAAGPFLRGSSTSLCAFAAALVAAALGSSCAGHHASRRGDPATASTAFEEGRAARLLEVAGVREPIDAPSRRRFVELADLAACPCPPSKDSLASCAASARALPCAFAPLALRSILRGVLREEPEEEVLARQKARFGPRTALPVLTFDAPCRGPREAPVEIALFSDFE